MSTGTDVAAHLPGFAGKVETDGPLLTRFVATFEGPLRELPEPADRTDQQRDAAAAIHNTCRLARQRFLDRHVRALYLRLTDDLRRPLRLAELVAEAARMVTGLVPSAAAMAAERGRPQAAKEGSEIDHGIFVRAVLLDDIAGPHLMSTMLRPTARAADLLAGFGSTGRVRLDKLSITRRDGVGEVILDDSVHLNAEDEQTVDDLETAVDLVLLDPATEVGLLRGGVMTHPKYRGRRVFCAGINLRELHHGRISLVDFLLRRELGPISKMERGLEPVTSWSPISRQKPWVVAIDSFAIGGGAQLALAADHVVIAADAYLSLPAAQEGIVPGAANFRLARSVGGRLARELVLTGRRIDALDPAAHELCDEVAPAASLDSAIQAAAQALKGPAVVANRHLLLRAEQPADRFRHYLADFAVIQAQRLYAQDVHAKIAGFPAGAGR